ncbi:sensor histidine kinase [Luteithermobacter gelatinilyticus]|uniref:sensor histidine kinase n=1 Tax=Luteithermobacter gelatinilyticus TaxID=2582913 RepID=UPI00143D1E83|nr:ATP-binding protein [Luteithermobacter gelatinilyticus]
MTARRFDTQVTDSLSFKLAKTAVLLALAIGVTLSLVQVYLDFVEEERSLEAKIQEILYVVEKPAARAVYILDEQLAQHVLEGLMVYDFVDYAALTDDMGQKLASVSRAPTESVTHWLSDRLLAGETEFSIPLPLPGEAMGVTGRLDIRINRDAALAGFYDRAVTVFFTGVVRNMLLVLLLYLAFYYIVARPLKGLSRKISAVDPAAPDRRPVEVPAGHEEDEFGLLARSFNDFAAAINRQYDKLKHTQQELAFARDELIQELQAHKETGAHLVEMKLKADKANQAKSYFLANMSHELRTPLNAIIGFASLISGETLGPVGHETYKEYLREIELAGRNLTNLLGQILDLARIESGGFELQETTFSVSDLIENCLLSYQTFLDEKRLILVKNLDENLGQIQGDRLRLRQVLANILSNAVKFSPEGGKITVSAHYQEDRSFLISVADEGVGIPQDKLEHVLEPFVQADVNYNKVYQGAGLGLSLSSSLVKLHGGKIWIESREKKGTTVYIEIPEKRVMDQPEVK